MSPPCCPMGRYSLQEVALLSQVQNFSIRRLAFVPPLEIFISLACFPPRLCCPTARSSLQQVTMASQARNCTIQRREPGRSQAASRLAAFFTQRLCCAMGTCLLQEVRTGSAATLRVWNCIARRVALGQP